MRRKGLLAVAIAVALAMSTGGLYAFGMKYYEVDYSWYSDEARAAGSYVIKYAGELEAFANLVNGTADLDGDGEPDVSAHDFEGETVTLGGDIHFTARNIYYAYSLTPIGTEEHPFEGAFDGGNWAIGRLLLTNADAEGANAPTSCVGLFGHVGKNGSVKNVNLKDTCAIRLKVADKDARIGRVGAVAGWCEGSISDCTAATDMQVVWDDGNAGKDRPAANATVIDGVGGIAGYCDGDMGGCTFKGSLEVTTPADAYHIVSDDTHMVNVVKYVGGIVGRSGGDPVRAGVANRVYGSVSGCANSANLNVVTSGAGGRDRFDEVVDSKSQYVGGIAGYAIGDVSACKNTGNIAATSYVVDYGKSDEENENGLDQADGGGDNVGGIVGGFRSEGYTTIWPTEADERRAKDYFRDGGIGVDRGIAGMYEAGADQIYLSGCTNLGRIEACSNVGGIAGEAGSFTNIASCVNGDPKRALADSSYAKVFSTRWNKPRTGGIAGASYGRVSYCRNHGQVANTKIGYYVGGIVGDLYFRRDATNAKYDTPELWACYNTGICASGMLRRGTIAGGNGGYVHDCLYLYGLTGGEDDEERTGQVAVGYEAPGDVAVQKNLKVAYASDTAAAAALAAGDEGAISLKSAEAIAWLNENAQREGWAHYWMLTSSANRGYPVLKEEGYESVAEMDLNDLGPQATLVRNASYTASMNPVPQVKLTVSVAGRKKALVQNADFYVVPDEAALDSRGACKGVTTGKPYTAHVQGIGNYTGVCCNVAYGIDRGDFSECGIYVATARYTGKAQNPDSIYVVDASGRAIGPDAYTFVVNAGEDCIDPGSYAVTATAVAGGNYRGSCTGKYVISKIDIAQDCDVVGVTYTEPKKPGQVEASEPRVWFYDDNVYKLYEVNPVLEGGKLTYYTLDELKGLRDEGGWEVTDELLEGYVGYPKVEGFGIEMRYNSSGARPLTSATPKARDADDNPVYGMSADYIATDIKPKVIGVNYELGRLDDKWWKTIYGGGSSGATVSVNDVAAEGSRNIESWTKGSITVAYSQAAYANAFTTNYDVLSFDINKVKLTADGLDITQTTTVVKYNDGKRPENLPAVKMKYLNSVVDPSNYVFELDHVVDANGNVRGKDSIAYNVSDALYYRLHFHDGGSIECDDIELHVTVIQDQKPIDDRSITVTWDEDWNNVYTFDGIANRGLTLYDAERRVTLREGVDYELRYNNYARYATPTVVAAKDEDKMPGVSVRGLDGYTGRLALAYEVEKTELDKETVEAIGRGENAQASLSNRRSFLNVTPEQAGPYFVYRVQGYDRDYLSENLGLIWRTADWSNAQGGLGSDAVSNGFGAFQGHIFEVVRIRDSQGNDVSRATKPGKYLLTVSGSETGNCGFTFPTDEQADVPLYIIPMQLQIEDVFTGVDGGEHRVPTYSMVICNLKTEKGTVSYNVFGNRDVYPYTGNAVQPDIIVADGYYYDHRNEFERKAKEGGAEYKAHLLGRENYRVKTEGFEDQEGPVDTGRYYAVSVEARDGNEYAAGSRSLATDDYARSLNQYEIVAADLDGFKVADAGSDRSDGKWIEVGEAFYGDEGAEPEVTFWVDGERCSYVEGEDYRLDYRDNTQVGTGTVRITVLDVGHLTASERDDDANPYVEVPFEILGDKVNLADTGVVTWTLPDKLAVADAATGALVDVPANATYENSLGRTVSVPADAYTLTCGVLDEAGGTFTPKAAGWQEGQTVWFQVSSTGKYDQFTATPVAGSGVAASAAGSSGLVAASSLSIVGHTVIGHAAVTAGSSLSTANQTGEPIMATLEADTLPYSGAEDVPAVTVADDGVALVEGRDYVLERSAGAGAGTATVTVRGIGSYTGSCELPFTVEPVAISSSAVSVLVDPVTYMGSVLRPDFDSIHVSIGGVALPASDYKVASHSEDSVNAGAGAGSLVLAAASGNLTGEVAVAFDILGMPLDPERFSVETQPQDFTGANVALPADGIAVTDTRTGRRLVYGTDFAVGYAGDHRSVGEASIIVSGRGNYASSLEASFKIVGSDLSGAKVEVLGGTDGAGKFEYTGKAITPDLKVTLNGQELEAGDDYKASYSNNVNKGPAAVTVTGQGNCTGTAEATFAIEAADVSRCTVYQKTDDYAYTGVGVEPAVVLRLGGVRVPASEYKLSYRDASGGSLSAAPVEIGSYQVEISGRGDNLGGVAFASFNIVQAPIGECRITLDGAWYDFGAQVKPAVSVATAAGVALGSDEFTVTYGPGTELGARSWVYVEAAGRHLQGTTYSMFTIGRIPISAADVKFAGGGSYEWTGRAIKPVPTIAIGERVLKEGADFNVEYLGDCKGIGTQPVEITCPATSVYTSDATAKYTIVKATQTITVTSKFSKTFGSVKTFKLNAKTNGDGKLTYSSSNTKVATVNSAGTVTVKAAGTARITVKCAAGKMWKAAPSKTVTISIAKAAQPLKASGKTAAASFKTLKKRNVTLARSKLVAVSKAQGKVTYKKTSGNSKITVSSAGKFTVKKGLKKGTYTVKVKVTAAGNANYKSGYKTATCKVRVK